MLLIKEKIFVESDNNAPPIIEEMADFILVGGNEMAKFGWALTPLFYNNDVYEDLAISAPITG